MVTSPGSIFPPPKTTTCTALVPDFFLRHSVRFAPGFEHTGLGQLPRGSEVHPDFQTANSELIPPKLGPDKCPFRCWVPETLPFHHMA